MQNLDDRPVVLLLGCCWIVRAFRHGFNVIWKLASDLAEARGKVHQHIILRRIQRMPKSLFESVSTAVHLRSWSIRA